MASNLEHEDASKPQFDDFETVFDAREYLDIYYDPVHIKTQNGVLSKVAKNLFDIFDSAIPNNPSGTALDFGCGPTIVGAMCTSRRIPNVVCADLLDECRHEISKWLNNASDAFDWSAYIKYMSDKEGIGPYEVEERTRSAIKHVIPCDARADTPLGDSPPLAPYDVIMSNLVLQTACPTKEGFIKTIKYICYHLKPTGVFIMSGVLNEDGYSFGDPPKKFKNVNHTEDDVREAFKAAEMTVISMDVYNGDDEAEDTHLPGAMKSAYKHFILTSRKCNK